MKSLMLKAAKEASKIILKHYGNYGKLKFKNPRSLLTKVDLLSDKKIKEIISKKYPKHNFLTEESGQIKKGSEYTWIIDPIDGTTNFTSKIPYFAVSIGLARNNKVIMGIVYNPCTKETFFAEKGKGAFFNNKKINVSDKKNMKDALLAFALPSSIKITKKTLSLLSKIFGSVRGMRNPGSAALNMCYVAAGKFDLFLSLSLNSWDAAAAFLIIEEAGGKVTNLKNQEWKISDRTCIATNKSLHDKFIELLNK